MFSNALLLLLLLLLVIIATCSDITLVNYYDIQLLAVWLANLVAGNEFVMELRDMRVFLLDFEGLAKGVGCLISII